MSIYQPTIAINPRDGMVAEARRGPGAAVASAYLILLVACFASRSMALAGLALTVSCLLAFAYRSAFDRTTATERAVLLLVASTMTVLLPLAAYRGGSAIAHYAVVVATLLCGYVLTRDLAAYVVAARAVLLTVLFAVAVYVLNVGVMGFPLDRMIPGSSSNGITSYLVALQVNYCLANYAATRRPAFVTPLLTLAVCVVGYGRSSILAALAIIALNAVTVLSPRRPWRASVGAVVLVIAAAAIAIQHGDAIADFVQSKTKIGSGLYDPHRAIQIREYAERIDGLTLLVGANYHGTVIESRYNNNPHNAYIRAHHVFGLPYLLLMLALPWLLQSSAVPLGVRTYMFAMLGILLLRAVTEPILFPTLLDVVYFACCFALAGSGARQAALRAAR